MCETGFPEPDMVTVVKPDVVEEGAWFTVTGTDTPGGGLRGSTEERSFRGTEVDPAELLSELVPSLSFVDGTVGWGTWCFCQQYTFLTYVYIYMLNGMMNAELLMKDATWRMNTRCLNPNNQ